MKKAYLLIILIASAISCFAQQKPGNNLGKSLLTMQREFPELRYIRTDEKGAFYEDGYPEDGIGLFFYFRNKVVVEECMICESTDGFPKMWYDQLWETFSSNYPSAVIKNTYNTKVFDFGDFKVHLIFYSEYGTNTALIVYER